MRYNGVPGSIVTILFVVGLIVGAASGAGVTYALTADKQPSGGSDLVAPMLDENGNPKEIDTSKNTSQTDQVKDYEVMYGRQQDLQNFLRQVNSYTKRTDIGIADGILYGVSDLQDGIPVFVPLSGGNTLNWNGKPVTWFDSQHLLRTLVAVDLGLGIDVKQVLSTAEVVDNEDFLPVIVGYNGEEPILAKQSTATVTVTAYACYNDFGAGPLNTNYKTRNDRGLLYKVSYEPISWLDAGSKVSLTTQMDDVLYAQGLSHAMYNAVAQPQADGTRSSADRDKLYQEGLPNLQTTSGDLFDPNAYDLTTYAVDVIAKNFGYRGATVIFLPYQGEYYCGTGEKLVPDNLDELLRRGLPDWYQLIEDISRQ